MALRFDHGEIRTDSTGVRTARLTRVGVFAYRQPDGTIRRELRHPDHVFNADSMATLRCAPMTVEHPAGGYVTPDNYSAVVAGSVGDQIEIEDQRYLRAAIKLIRQDAVDGLGSGQRRQISCGYDTKLDATPGIWNGERYDVIQTEIRYNHAAMVLQGRAGNRVAVLDSMAADSAIQLRLDAEDMPAPDVPDGSGSMFKLDGKDYTEAEIRSALDAQTKLTAVELELASAQARADSAATEDAIRKDEATKVRARVELELAAQPHLDEAFKLDSSSDDAIRSAVIRSLDKDADLTGTSGAYLSARMDMALAAHATRVDHVGAARPRADATDHTQRTDAAQEWEDSRMALKGHHAAAYAATTTPAE